MSSLRKKNPFYKTGQPETMKEKVSGYFLNVKKVYKIKAHSRSVLFSPVLFEKKPVEEEQNAEDGEG